MRRALFILLVALGGFLTAFIGGSAVAGALELPGSEHVENLTGTVHQDQTGTVENQTDQRSKAGVDNQQSNVYAPISILSPTSGDNHVEQGNKADNQAGSAVVNGTDQSATQDQTGTATTTDNSRDDSRDGGWDKGSKDSTGSEGSDEGGSAAVDQSQTGTVANETTQSSKAGVDNRQTNVYAPISILSPTSGDNHVEQGNKADNSAGSVVVNGTDQSLDQGQTGTATTTDNSRDEGGWNNGGGMNDWNPTRTAPVPQGPNGSDGGTAADVDQSQTGTVKNSTDQKSTAEVENRQRNTFVPLSFLSPTSGDSKVQQGNQARNEAGSIVINGTDQGLTQHQTGTATATDDSKVHGGWSPWNWNHHDDCTCGSMWNHPGQWEQHAPR